MQEPRGLCLSACSKMSAFLGFKQIRRKPVSGLVRHLKGKDVSTNSHILLLLGNISLTALMNKID